jgi:EAL domain-containing protein (putative c-di-GMP-specific phosphodiesterase class I)
MYILLNSALRCKGAVIMTKADSFYHSFQPIIFLEDWSYLGFEGFLRTESTGDIEGVFQLAMKNDRLFELDTKSIYNVISSYFEAGYPECLFVNIFPSTLTHSSFIPFLERLEEEVPFSTSKIVFEINEGEKIDDLNLLCKSIDHLRRRGFSFAIDDFGKGEMTIQIITELEPDFVKIDRFFATDLHLSDKKQEQIQGLLFHFKDNSLIILEGIEKPEELAIAKLIGVPIGQGHLLGRPGEVNEYKRYDNMFKKSFQR